MAVQNDNTILKKADLKAYHQRILPYLGGNVMVNTSVSDYYSTDEKMIGVWKDGRPIYQKVLTSTIPANGSSTTIDIASLGSKDIIDLRMLANSSNNSVQSGFWLGQVSGLRDVIIWVNATGSPDNGKIYIRNDGMTDRVGDPVDIIIQYTKTADAAGSAVTAPGAYDINFPNTWPTSTEIFFGNGVYGKRWTGSFTASATWTDVAKQLDTINLGKIQLVNRGGGIQRRGGDTTMPFGTYIESGGIGYDIWYAHDVSGQPNGFRLRGKDNGTHTEDYDIWVTYTK